MPEDTDSRDFFKYYRTYQGQYQWTLAEGFTSGSQNVMLTADNILQFQDDVEGSFTAEQVFATLPTDICPGDVVVVPVMTDTGVVGVSIAPAGSMSCMGSASTLHLRGVCCSISDRYYR